MRMVKLPSWPQRTGKDTFEAVLELLAEQLEFARAEAVSLVGWAFHRGGRTPLGLMQDAPEPGRVQLPKEGKIVGSPK